MESADRLQAWLQSVSGNEWIWFTKRLAANDTGATGGHQVGFYVPKDIAFGIAPALQQEVLNPRLQLSLYLVSHSHYATPSIIYYNNKVVAHGTRDEARITGFGGHSSPIQDPENTGALLFLAFLKGRNEIQGWLARDPDEEQVIEDSTGTVEPGTIVGKIIDTLGRPILTQMIPAGDGCTPRMADLPPAWVKEFPSGQALSDEAARRTSSAGDADSRLMRRYRCEFSLFKVVEAEHTLPLVKLGFTTVDEFLAIGQVVAQRRKSRAGRALELQVRRIFNEEEVDHSYHAEIEGGRVPDFIFPSRARYESAPSTGASHLHMLAVKTTLKDRWRQVLDEAAKIREKHLFTIAEGVSEGQYRQMAEGGIRLVTPKENRSKFPISIRPEILTLAAFIRLVNR